jgi:ribonuclease HI
VVDVVGLDAAGRRQHFGEILFPLVQKIATCASLAGKIVGMLLEIQDIQELLHLASRPSILAYRVRECEALLDPRPDATATLASRVASTSNIQATDQSVPSACPPTVESLLAEEEAARRLLDDDWGIQSLDWVAQCTRLLERSRSPLPTPVFYSPTSPPTPIPDSRRPSPRLSSSQSPGCSSRRQPGRSATPEPRSTPTMPCGHEEFVALVRGPDGHRAVTAIATGDLSCVPLPPPSARKCDRMRHFSRILSAVHPDKCRQDNADLVKLHTAAFQHLVRLRDRILSAPPAHASPHSDGEQDAPPPEAADNNTAILAILHSLRPAQPPRLAVDSIARVSIDAGVLNNRAIRKAGMGTIFVELNGNVFASSCCSLSNNAAYYVAAIWAAHLLRRHGFRKATVACAASIVVDAMSGKMKIRAKPLNLFFAAATDAFSGIDTQWEHRSSARQLHQGVWQSLQPLSAALDVSSFIVGVLDTPELPVTQQRVSGFGNFNGSNCSLAAVVSALGAWQSTVAETDLRPLYNRSTSDATAEMRLLFAAYGFTPGQKDAAEVLDTFVERNPSLSVIQVRHVSGTACPGCGFTSSSSSSGPANTFDEVSNTLPIPVPDTTRLTTLQQLVDGALSSEEQLDVTCRCNTKLVRRQTVAAGSRVVLQLKRFNATRRLNTPVAVGSSVVLGGDTYSVVALVCHHGKRHSGHYYAQVQRLGGWYEIDDESHTKIVRHNANPSHIYLIFLQRSVTPGPSPPASAPIKPNRSVRPAPTGLFGAGPKTNPLTPACTCVGRRAGRQGRHRIGCPKSTSSKPMSATFFTDGDVRSAVPTQSGNGQPGSSVPPLTEPEPEPPPEPPPEHVSSWPSIEEVFRTRVRTVDRIPPSALLRVTKAFQSSVRWACSTSHVRAWHHTLIFTKCVLLAPPRGGAANTAQWLIGRAKRWSQHKIGDLWAEVLADAATSQTAPRAPADAAPGPPGTTPVADTNLPPSFDTFYWTDGTTPATPAQEKRAIVKAKAGHFSKAISLLGAAQPAPRNDETEAALRDLHPHEDMEEPPDDFPRPSCPAAARGKVLSLLRRFNISTGSGPSGLKVTHLTDMVRCRGLDFATDLAGITSAIAAGHIPKPIRRFLYGASLSALAKKSGGVRPIASGEILRRLSAKYLCAMVKVAARPFFLRVHQMGVAVGGGAETIVHASRRSRESLHGVPHRGFVKLDMTNAFNRCRRGLLLPLARRHFPDLAGYVEAAYGMPSSLFWGDVVLTSASGVQQGDPLGPLLFALLLADLWENTGRPELPLDLLAWYLDDGIFAGDLDDLAAFVTWFESAGVEYGFLLNRSKSELILQPHSIIPPALIGLSVRDWDAWDILGSPIGSTAHIHAYTDQLMTVGARKCARISCLSNSHVAYALLRYCASSCLAVYWQRTLGHFPALNNLWTAMTQCFNAVCCPCPTDLELLQMQLPLRLGGFGLRDPTVNAAIAFICSTSASSALLPTVIPASSALVHDSRLAAALSSAHAATPSLATDLAAYAESGKGKFGDKAQATFTRRVEAGMLERLTTEYERSGNTRGLSRLQSCQAAGSSAYLTLQFVSRCEFNCWLPPDIFGLLCRRRLGLPIYPTEHVCQLCGKVTCDVFGDHTMRCMSWGEKTRAHHRLVESLFGRTSAAMLLAQREVCPFEDETGARVDILALHAKPLPKAIDVAITHAVDEPASWSTPGGGASKYQTVKVKRYGALCAKAGFELVPVVADTHGAWGDKAYPFFTEIARGLARRFGTFYPTTYQLLLLELNVVLFRSLGRMLLLNLPPEIPGNRSPTNAAEAPGCRVER